MNGSLSEDGFQSANLFIACELTTGTTPSKHRIFKNVFGSFIRTYTNIDAKCGLMLVGIHLLALTTVAVVSQPGRPQVCEQWRFN